MGQIKSRLFLQQLFCLFLLCALFSCGTVSDISDKGSGNIYPGDEGDPPPISWILYKDGISLEFHGSSLCRLPISDIMASISDVELGPSRIQAPPYPVCYYYSADFVVTQGPGERRPTFVELLGASKWLYLEVIYKNNEKELLKKNYSLSKEEAGDFIAKEPDLMTTVEITSIVITLKHENETKDLSQVVIKM
jgi:hypothetical protein